MTDPEMGEDRREGGVILAGKTHRPQESIPPLEADGSSPQVKQALNKLAGQGRMTTETILAMTGTMGINPLHQKMTAEHITQVLTLSEKHDEREFELSRTQQKIDSEKDARDRQYHLYFFVIAIVVFGFILVLFREKPDILKPVLTGLGGLISGFLAGMGYTKAKVKQE